MATSAAGWTMQDGVWAPPGRSVYEGSQDTRLRQFRPNLDREMASMLSRERHRAMVSDARWIYTSFPLVSGAVTQKADYVSNSRWALRYTGENEEWGRRAQEWTKKANKICDVRGPMFHWEKNWWIGCCLWDIDGDWFILLTESKDGFPQFQFLETYRVATRWQSTASEHYRGSRNTVLKSGKYAGHKILNGIVYNESGRAIAYNVLGSSPDKDRVIPARNMIHVANPQWFSEGRPVPALAYSVLDFYDVKETRGFEKIGMKMNSALAIIEENSTGRASNINERTPANPITGAGAGAFDFPSGLQVETFDGGMIKYVRAGKGSIKAHESKRPGDSWMKFDQTIVAGAFFGMGWRIEMLDPSRLAGAPTRGFQDNINQSIFSRHTWMAPHAVSAHCYRIAKAIERGDLPENEDWWKWKVVRPREYTVDYKNSSATARENIRAGIENYPEVIGRMYGDPEELITEQAKFLQLRQRIAKDYGVDPNELGRLDKPGDAPATNEPSENNKDDE